MVGHVTDCSCRRPVLVVEGAISALSLCVHFNWRDYRGYFPRVLLYYVQHAWRMEKVSWYGRMVGVCGCDGLDTNFMNTDIQVDTCLLQHFPLPLLSLLSYDVVFFCLQLKRTDCLSIRSFTFLTYQLPC